MIKYFFLLSAVVLMTTGCSKKNNPQVYTVEKYPQQVILVIENDNDPLFNEYITAPGSTVRRAEVGKEEDEANALYNSTHARECVWIANLEGNNVYFRLASDTSIYLRAAPNRVNDTEYMLMAGSKGYNGDHLFKTHLIERRDGNKITAMESVLYPQHYFSHEGVVSEGNAVKLNLQQDEANAVKVIWYSRMI